ncbi:type VI secretion system contractile sheath large subunit [Nautilia lithotrophica]
MAEEKVQQQQTEEKVSLIDDILSATKLTPEEEGYEITKKGVEVLINNLLKSEKKEKVSKQLIDEMIAEIDKKLSSQMDEILHNEKFQKLESAWRSLKFLVDKIDFRENIKLEILNVSKDELREDFEDAPEVVQSGLYKIGYTKEYGQFGGEPYALMIGNYEFDASAPDIALMKNIASVATMMHAPFIGLASPKMFGIDSFTELPNLKDIKSIFEMPQYAKWRSFRESEDARNFALTLPRFLLRVPYGKENPVKSFNYNETVKNHDDFVWGNTAFAFASNVARSFAKYRWASNIIGPQGGGAVEDLPVYTYEAMGGVQTKIPTEVLISERLELELSEQGFIALTMRKGSDNAAFFSANSVQKPKKFPDTPEGKKAELNFKLGTQLPYNFIISRLAHYIKVIQRENIGTWKSRGELEDELNKWIRQYVSDQENPSPGVRSRRPLRKAEIHVYDVPGEPGWYKVTLKVVPHFKYMGASFELSLVGKLDKE